MKLLTALALAIVVGAPSIAVADEVTGKLYFGPHQRATPHAIGLGSIDGRYPTPGYWASSMNIPNGAGAPVPIDPFSLPRPYAEGESAVPLQWYSDAKGNATYDVKGRAAWDGSPGRMAW